MPLDMLPLPAARQPEQADPRSQDQPAAAPPVTVGPVRLLSPEEIASLRPIFEAEGGVMPAPEHSFFMGTVAPDGHVTSFMVVQLRVHAEPMWIEKGNERLFLPLIHATEQMIAEKVPGGCDVFLFAPAGKVSMLAAKAGMRLEPWTVWSKHVEGVAASESAPEPVEAVN